MNLRRSATVSSSPTFRRSRSMPMGAGRIAILVGCLAIAGVLPSAQQRGTAVGDWASYGGTNWSQKYSALNQIKGDNFNKLKVAWTWRSPDHQLLMTLPAYREMPLNASG